jgi:hypothetical protein
MRNYWSEEPSWFKALRLFRRPMRYLTLSSVQVCIVLFWHVLTRVFCFGSAVRPESVGEGANVNGRAKRKECVVC